MTGYKPGDRVWVKNPNQPVERKVGTVMQVRKTAKGVRYVVEWEVDLMENGHEQTGYSAEEIAAANNEHNGHNGRIASPRTSLS